MLVPKPEPPKHVRAQHLQGVPNTSKIIISLPQNTFSGNINNNELETESNKNTTCLEFIICFTAGLGTRQQCCGDCRGRGAEARSSRDGDQEPQPQCSHSAAPTANWELWDGEAQPVGVVAAM